MKNKKEEFSTIFKNDKRQKGVSLYFSLIIMTVLLAIALGISTILTGQTIMIRSMGDSVIAFYAADTGVERILYEDKLCRCNQAGDQPGCCNSTSCKGNGCCKGNDCNEGLKNNGELSDKVGGTGPSYEVNFDDSGTSIKSMGSFNDTVLAIEVNR